MNILSEEEVMHVAKLANLRLTNNEVNKFKEQLAFILNDIEKIKSIDISGDIMIAPTIEKNRYCEDKVTESLSLEEIKKNANNVYGDFIAVPKVLHD